MKKRKKKKEKSQYTLMYVCMYLLRTLKQSFYKWVMLDNMQIDMLRNCEIADETKTGLRRCPEKRCPP